MNGEAAAVHDEIISVVDGGANSTAKAMKIDISAITNVENICELSHRNSWPTNAFLEVGKEYELSFYLKSEGTFGACWWLNVFSYCPDWLNDPLRGAFASTDWKDVYGTDYVETSMQNLYSNVITQIITDETQAEGYRIEGALSADWTKYTFNFKIAESEDAPAGTVYKNCYLCMGLSGIGAIVYLDEVQINEIKE